MAPWREPIGSTYQKKRSEEEQELNRGYREKSVQQVLAPHGTEEPNPTKDEGF